MVAICSLLFDPAGNRSPSGRLYGACLRRRTHLAGLDSAACREAHLQTFRRECDGRDELARVCLCHAGLLRRHPFAHVSHRAFAGAPALEPAGACRSGTRSGLEYGCQFYHQHQLAVLYPRDDHVLSHPDGRSRHAQFLVGGRGHLCGRGPHPRNQAHHFRHHRKLLGGHDARAALRSHPGFDRLRAAAGGPGSTAEPARLHHGSSPGTANAGANHRARAGGFAGSHQDAGHQWRWVLQCQ